MSCGCRLQASGQGTPNGVMLLPPEACVFSSYMCVYFYCLKYEVVFLLAFSVTAKNLIKICFVLTSNQNSSASGMGLFYVRVNVKQGAQDFSEGLQASDTVTGGLIFSTKNQGWAYFQVTYD